MCGTTQTSRSSQEYSFPQGRGTRTAHTKWALLRKVQPDVRMAQNSYSAKWELDFMRRLESMALWALSLAVISVAAQISFGQQAGSTRDSTVAGFPVDKSSIGGVV